MFCVLAALMALGAGSGTAVKPTVDESPWSTVQAVPAEMPDPLARRESWESKDVYYYRSILSPGMLLRFKSRAVRFFGDHGRYGAEAPSFFVVRTRDGASAVQRGGSLDGSEMTASWIVTSFQGCKGWEQFDVPWFLSLEKRPRRVSLSEKGLVLEFGAEDSGHIFSMPLYGYYKPPQKDNDFAAKHGLPSPRVRPWEWMDKPPESLLSLSDWWAETAKAYPIGFSESFSVRPATDEIVFRQDYRWLFLKDDWNTTPRRFATLSPSLGLAWKFPGFPMEVSGPVHDPEYFTAFGPYVGVLEVDRVEVAMRVLQYTNEMEKLPAPPEIGEGQRQALGLIVDGMEHKFRSDWQYFYDHGSRENFCWNIVGDVWYPRALPFVDRQLRERAQASLRIYLENDVLRPHSPYHGKYILHGPGIGSWGGWGDAGKIMTDALQPIWAYGQFTGDWELLGRNWGLIQRFFITPEEADWVSFGRQAIAEIGDEAAPCSAYARIAWAVGDPTQYLFGAYMFARELVHLYVKQRAGSYFYEHQPYNQYDPMPARIYPTDLWGSTRGWQVDGPSWGHLASGERQSANRWMRFHDPDVGRFFRENLRQEVGNELEWLHSAGLEAGGNTSVENYKDWLVRDNPHNMTSFVRLQSLLLGLPDGRLQGRGDITAYRSWWGAADIAVGYSFLRAMTPVRYSRLVPKDLPASPFVPGLQARGPRERLTTVQEIWEPGIDIEPRWNGWNMPRNPGTKPESAYRSFGSISGDFHGRVSGAADSLWISYGCQVSWAETVQPSPSRDTARLLAQQDETSIAVAGPFGNESDAELTDKSYPPEADGDLESVYRGASGPVTWRRTTLKRGRRADLSPELSDGKGNPNGSLAYVQQYVWSPVERQVYLLAGHQGGIVAWINGDKVLNVHQAHLRTEDDSARGLGGLRSGWNRMVLKVESFTNQFDVQFRLVGVDGRPLPDLRFAAGPTVSGPN